jgi:hypothetical protein
MRLPWIVLSFVGILYHHLPSFDPIEVITEDDDDFPQEISRVLSMEISSTHPLT